VLTQLIRKKGTIDCDVVKSTPVVFKEVLYRFECMKRQGSPKEPAYLFSRFVNAATGEASFPVAVGLDMTTAFVWENKIHIFGIKNQTHVYETNSDDLISWSTPVPVIGAPEWGIYNGTVCRAGDHFVMGIQMAEPLWFVVVPFTFFFAESKDLKKWKLNFDAVFGRQKYVDTPMIRYFDGWYYLFYVAGSYDAGFEERVVRSRDMRNWLHSPLNPILQTSVQDRELANTGFTPKQQKRIQTVHNINNSDLQMCAYGSGLYMTYIWGDQKNNNFLAEAEIRNMTEQEFCEACFPEN